LETWASELFEMQMQLLQETKTMKTEHNVAENINFSLNGKNMTRRQSIQVVGWHPLPENGRGSGIDKRNNCHE